MVCGRIVEWYKKYFYTSPKASRDLIARVTAVVTGSPFVKTLGPKEDQEFMDKMFNLGQSELEDRMRTKVSEYSVKYGKYGVKNDN